MVSVDEQSASRCGRTILETASTISAIAVMVVKTQEGYFTNPLER